MVDAQRWTTRFATKRNCSVWRQFVCGWAERRGALARPRSVVERVLADATVVCLGMTRDGERSGRSEVLAGTDADGLLRSEDDGATWTSANPGLLDPTVLCLASTPGSTSFAGTPTGMYRSGNAGRSWREVELPCGSVGVECLAASDELVLAGTDAAGAFASRDEGRSWSRVAGLAASAVTALSIGGGHGLLAVGSPDGVHVSRDGGATWHIDPIGTVLSLAWLPDCLLAGVAGDGVLRLDGTSRQWQPASSGLHGRLVVDLAWSPQTDTLLTADLEAGVQRSNDSGRTWQFAHEGPPGASHVAVGSDVVYAATTGGLFTSRDAGLTWSVVRAGAACIAVATTTAGEALAAFDDSRLLMVGSDGRERCVEWDVARGRIQSVALLDGDMLFVGTVGDRSVVWRSIDSGQSWAAWFQAEPVPALCMALSGRAGPAAHRSRLARVSRSAQRPRARRFGAPPAVAQHATRRTCHEPGVWSNARDRLRRKLQWCAPFGGRWRALQPLE